MVRIEYVIAGCILTVVGLVIADLGYDKIQPTILDTTTSFIENLTGRLAPPSMHPSKATGYWLLSGGAIALLSGLGFILSSRNPRKPDSDKGQ